jgi:hypothetical protein
MKHSWGAWIVGVVIALANNAVSAEPVAIVLTAPKSNQVVQRVGFDPVAWMQKREGAGLGFADVVIRGQLPKGTERATWEYRIVPSKGTTGRGTDWTKLEIRVSDANFEATARVQAGGWYRFEIRCRANDEVVAQGVVESIGVGEVFVVAGQSYATNCNDERLNVADTHSRVVAFDSAKESWALANDPQPAPDGSDGGSIWPPLGDALLKEFGVPIGFANVAVGATSSMQWMPDGKLHPRLVQTGKTLGRFRAVLWQQGESDVIAKTTAETYVANLKTIRETAARAWGIEPPWLLAKSTLHPTVYNDPAGENRIRGAIDELVKLPGFRAGPDTDTLAGENRGDAKSRRHFSGIGQRRAAEMWFAVLKQELLRSAPQEALSSAARSTQALFVSNDGTFKRYRIPSLLITKKGTLLAICEGRVDGGGLTGNIDLVLRRSLDAGLTWQPIQKIADLGDDTLGNPCPVVDRETGTIWLPFTRSPGRFTEAQIVAGQSSGPTTVWLTRSDDDGTTWSEPRDISVTTRQEKWGWYGTGPGIGIQLTSGRLLIPCYHTEPGSGMYRSHAIFSDDHGVTWKLGETVGEHTAECQAIERRDGAVVLNMRGTNKQFFRSIATSQDGGQTWTEPQLDRNLPEPACQAALLAKNSAKEPIWLFCNPPGATRRNLTLRASTDEGQSWPIAKLVDAGPTEYSCMAWLPDGQIGLIYELSRTGQTYRPELHFARIPTNWLTEPASPEPFVPVFNAH